MLLQYTSVRRCLFWLLLLPMSMSMVRLTPNTCKSLLLGFVYAPFFPKQHRNKCSYYTHTQAQFPNAIEYIPQSVFDCVRFFFAYLYLKLLGDYMPCIQFQHHYIDSNQNHQLKARVHLLSAIFPISALAFKSISIPMTSRVCESIPENQECIYMYTNLFSLQS